MKKLILLLSMAVTGLYLHAMEPAPDQTQKKRSELDGDLYFSVLLSAKNPKEYERRKVNIQNLINHGADVNPTENNQVLLLARSINNPDLMQMLIDNHADVNAQLKDTLENPLQAALKSYIKSKSRDREEILKGIRVLLKNGALVNIQNADQNTPLMQVLVDDVKARPNSNFIAALTEILPVLAPKKFYRKNLSHASYINALPSGLREHALQYVADVDITIKNKNGKNTIDLLKEAIQKYPQDPQANALKEMIAILESK
jgi:ankyrin repeat protein